MDGAALEVIRSYLLSAAEEMRRTLIRTAFNPVVYEVLDFGISVYDGQLNLIAEAPGLTFFLGANDFAIRKGLEQLGPGSLKDGDVVLLNYPYWNSAHVSDVSVFSGVFLEDRADPVGFLCIRAHWMDLGAKDPGYVLDSTDMHQEGLIFPCVKICKQGRLDSELVEIIRFNSRMPELVLGDLNAQVAALRTGQRRLTEIISRVGLSQLQEAIDALLKHGEETTLRALEEMPQGNWSAEDWVDDDGISSEKVPIRATVGNDGRNFSVDFTGSSPAALGPINLPLGRTQTICKVALKALSSPNTPCNAGHFRPLRVIAPVGSLFNAQYPSATFTMWAAMIAFELVFKAVAKGMPERVAACSGGEVPGFMMVGQHPQTGRLYAISNNDPVGWGGSCQGDGNNATSHLSQSLVHNTPIEVLEMKTGLRVERLELRQDSGGPGRFRGGVGLCRDLYFVAPGELLSVMKRSKTPPWALAGGRSPDPSGMILRLQGKPEQKVGTARTPVRTGDRASNQTAGGGGWGNPLERDPKWVLEDFLDGYVSQEGALRDYGVVIRNGKIDEEATRRTRVESARG